MIGTRAAGGLPDVGIALPDLTNRIDPQTGEAGWTNTGIKGVGQRVGDWLHAPGTAGALLRGAAAALNGEGLGGSIQAGAGYVDKQKAIAAGAEQQQFENWMAGLRQAVTQQQADQTGRYQDGQLVNQALGIDETGRHNRAGEMIDANGQRIQLHGIDTNASVARRGQDVQVLTNREDNVTSRANNGATVGASIYGDNLRYMADTGPAGIGSKAGGYTETTTKVPAQPEVNRWFGTDTPAMPATETTVRAPLLAAPAGSPPGAAIAALKANPGMRGQFEAKYGAGSAAQFLGGR